VSLLSQAVAIAQAAGERLIKHFRCGVSYDVKKDRSFVSSADMESHGLIKRLISEVYPDHVILSEEDDQDQVMADLLATIAKRYDMSQETYLWVVDPLDGTSNFIHGLPYFNVSLACARLVGLPACFETMVGVVYNPISLEMYYAQRGGGAYKRVTPYTHQLLSLDRGMPLSQAFVACGYHGNDHSSHFVERYRKIMMTVESSRRMGSAALDIAKTAEGHFHVFFDPKVKAWDIMAGRLILEEVGGLSLSFPSVSPYKSDDIRREGIICGAPVTAELVYHQFSQSVSKDLAV